MPHGFKDANKIYYLLKALYSLKQSPRLWYKIIVAKLAEFRFYLCPYNTALFINNKKDIFITIQVNDFVITNAEKNKVDKVAKQLQIAYKIKYLSEISHYLSVSVLKREDRLYLYQTQYIDNLLERHDMNECRPILVPINPNYYLYSIIEGYKASPEDETEY